MRVLMLQPSARQQHAALDQCLDDGLVGVAFFALVVDHALADKARGMVGEGAVLVDGIGDRGVDAAGFQLARIRHPDVKVLTAVAGRGVDEAGAGVVGDVVAGEKRHREFVAAGETLERMAAFHCVERVGRQLAHLFIGADARLLEHAFGQRIGQNQKIAGLRPVIGWRIGDLVETVSDFRREADGAVAGQRPGCRGPDHDIRIRQRAMCGRGNRKFHPHHVGGVVLILDLRLGKRGLLHHAPHHGL